MDAYVNRTISRPADLRCSEALRLLICGRNQAAAAPSATNEPKTSPQLARGFHVWNLTGHPMRVDAIGGNAAYEGRPDVGHILRPRTMGS